MAEYRIDIDGNTDGIKAAKVVAVKEVREIGAEQQKQSAHNRDMTGRAAKANQEASDAVIKGHKDAGATGVRSWTDIYSAIGIARQGLDAFLTVARTVGNVLEENARKQREMTKDFTGQRDRIRELASVMGRTADTAFTLEQTRFEAASGFRESEALDFRKAFQGSGQQYVKRMPGQASFDQYEQEIAKLSVARGYTPNEAGDLAGSLAGMKDRSKMTPDAATADALADFSSSIEILQRGKGDLPVLLRNVSMLAASAMNEDAMRGTFTNPQDTSTAISVAAERNDAGSNELVRGAIRAIRDPGEKVADLRKRAGITPQTGFLESMTAIAPHLEKEAKDQGVKLDDILSGYWQNVLERESIGVFVNKGVSGGVIKDRTDYAKTLGGGAEVRASIDAARANPDAGIQLRLAEANKRLADVEQGARDAQLATLRAQAQEQIQRTGRGATLLGASERAIAYGGSFFSMDGGETQERLQMTNILRRRGRHAGVAYPEQAGIVSPEFTANQQRDMITRITAAGGDPFSDRGLPSNGLAGGSGSILNGMLSALKAIERQGGEGNLPRPLNGPPAGIPDRS